MSTTLSNKQAILVMNGLPHLGPVTMRRLLDAFEGDPLAVLSASKKELLSIYRIGQEVAATILNWPDHFDLEKEERRLAQSQIKFVGQEDDDYPPLLREIYDPPIGLYAKGDYRPALKTIAIVGSRRITLYGQKVAQQLGAELSRLGFGIISGLARGIDAAAHQGALNAGGHTAAVLGCGVDVVYPPENVDLYKEIGEKGVIFSEFRLGMRASKTAFPMRNRIVAGMSQAVIVVESDASGGSMITARLASEYNRTLFAVPGRIDQASSRGCHQLIKDGAILLTSVEDLLEEILYANPFAQDELDLETSESGAQSMVQEDWDKGLNDDEKQIMTHLIDGSIHSVDSLLEATELPIQAVSSSLLMLELKKKISKRVDGTFSVR